MMHGDFAKQFGLLKLGLQEVLLVPFSGAVPRVGCALDLLKQGSVALKDCQRLGQVRKLEICRPDPRENGKAYRLVLLLYDFGITSRDLAFEPQFARIG